MNVDKVYELFLKSEDYEKIVSKVKDVDLDWIKPRIAVNEFLLLEEYISSCFLKREQDYFTIGFNCALNLLGEKNTIIEYNI